MLLNNLDFGSVKKAFSRLKMDIKKSFLKIKEELNEHLDSINDNTNEIHSNYDYLCELDAKIDKLNERMEEMELLLHTISDIPIEKKKKSFKVKTLTRKEQEIFLALYTLEQENRPVTYSRIAEFLGLNKYLVQEHVMALIEKGVPVHKNHSENMVYLRLNPEFRDLQARNNIARIHSTISKKIFNI